MQYHYVVYYDDEINSWHIDTEVTSLRDGTVYDPSRTNWFTPVEGSPEDARDFALYRQLGALLTSFLGAGGLLVISRIYEYEVEAGDPDEAVAQVNDDNETNCQTMDIQVQEVNHEENE